MGIHAITSTLVSLLALGLMGDFNAILKSFDRLGGDMDWYGHHHEFSNCIQDTKLIQVPFIGPKFS